jgi:diadenosine tetraphosphate (Ap4A) HIT family hydrolase
MTDQKIFDNNACCICNEIRMNEFPLIYQQYYAIKKRICRETENFISFPSISPIVAGHMLIFPKAHIPNMISIVPGIYDELFELIDSISKHLSRYFDVPFIFEHGITRFKGNACGINHAHIHLVPLKKDTIVKVCDRIMEIYPINIRGELHSINQKADREMPYLLYGDSINQINLIHNQDIPSQFMRRIILEEIGEKEWDWKKLSNWDAFKTTHLSFADGL